MARPTAGQMARAGNDSDRRETGDVSSSSTTDAQSSMRDVVERRKEETESDDRTSRSGSSNGFSASSNDRQSQSTSSGQSARDSMRDVAERRKEELDSEDRTDRGSDSSSDSGTSSDGTQSQSSPSNGQSARDSMRDLVERRKEETDREDRTTRDESSTNDSSSSGQNAQDSMRDVVERRKEELDSEDRTTSESDSKSDGDTSGSRQSSSVSRDDYEDPGEYVEARAESQLENVDEGQIYTVRYNDRIEPRLTERGARQAAAAAIGVDPSEIELGESSSSVGYTVEDVAENVNEFARAVDERSEVRQESLERARDIAAVEAGEERRQREQQANEGIAAQARSEGVDTDKLEAQTGRDIDDDQDVTSPREYVAQEIEESFDTVERGRDFRVVEEEGTVRPEYTDEGLTRIETELETAAGGRADIDVQRTEGGGIEATTDRTERFGDGQVEIPGVIPVVGGRTLEENLEGASEAWQSFTGDIGSGVEDLADTGAAAVDALASDANPAAGPIESTLREGGDIASAGIRGGGAALNLPGVALGFKEAGETTGWLAKQTAQGEGQQAVSQLGQAGGAAASAGVSYAQQNPTEAAGMVVGSLATGYGVTRAASSAGAGRAAAFAIDPAEEIGGTVLTKGLSQTARGSRVVDELGGRVDIESTARYVGRGAGNRVRDATRAASQSYESFKRSDFMTDTRGQQNLLGSSRSRGESTGDVDSEVTTITAEDLDVGVQADPSQLRARPQGNFEGGETGGGPRGFGGGRESLPSRGVDSGGTVYERGYNPYGDNARPSDDIRGQAESRYVRADTNLDARFSGLGRVDVAADTRARLAAAQMVETRMDLDQQSRVDAAGRSDYRFDARSNFETDVRVDTTARMDTRTDTRLDSRIQTDQRTQVETGQRAESRTAARIETRTDGQRRSEWEWDNDPSYSEEDPRAAYQFDQDTWEVGIEDVGDLVFDDPPGGGR